jgi:hypothetical protein
LSKKGNAGQTSSGGSANAGQFSSFGLEQAASRQVVKNNSILNFGAPAIINMTTSNSKHSKSKSNKTSGSGPPKKVSSNVSGENTKKHGQKPSQVIFAT